MRGRHREEVAGAFVAVNRVRPAAIAVAIIGLVGFVRTVGAMLTDSIGIANGFLVLVATALLTVFPAAALYSSSYRVSLRAIQLEERLERQERKKKKQKQK